MKNAKILLELLARTYPTEISHSIVLGVNNDLYVQVWVRGDLLEFSFYDDDLEKTGQELFAALCRLIEKETLLPVPLQSNPFNRKLKLALE